MAVKQALTLTQLEQSVLENTSKVRILWTSTQTGGSHNLNKRTAYYWISINDSEEVEYEVSYKLNYTTTDTILDMVLTVEHDTLGKAKISVRTEMDTKISAGVVELSQTLELDTIPRAATITATDAFIGGKSTVVLGNWNSAFVYVIAYKFKTLSGFIDTQGNAIDREAILTASVYNFTLPNSFYSEIPDEPTGKCVLTCYTYSGMQLLGSTECEFTATADPSTCSPLLIASVTDINTKTTSLTGNAEVLIRNYSTAQCKASALPAVSSSILELIICGVSVDRFLNGSIDIENVTQDSFDFIARDSRGYETIKPIKPTIIPYSDIVCYPSAGRVDPTSGKVWLTIEGSFYDGNFGVVQNSLSVTYRVNDQTRTYSPTVENGKYRDDFILSDLDYTKSHTIEIEVSDAVTTVTRTAKVRPGIPVFDWGADNFHFNVPVNLPELYINGQSLSDYIRAIIQGG